jgi:hypothetical protein
VRINPYPWRDVVAVEGPRSGRGSMLGPDTARRVHTWELTLQCKHKVSRKVRYGPDPDGFAPQRGGTQFRSLGDALPPPVKVRCERCPARITA